MAIFKASPGNGVDVTVNGRHVRVPAGSSAAAAALFAGLQATRLSPVDRSRRAPYCMMGVCFECLMTIDGDANQQGCMINVRPDMVIECHRDAGERT